MALTADEIKNAGIRVDRVETPEWGGDGHVFVRVIGADQIGAVQAIGTDGDKDEASTLADWCVLGVCDENANLLFTPDDIPSLVRGALMPLQRCATAIMELNGITGAAHEDLAKN